MQRSVPFLRRRPKSAAISYVLLFVSPVVRKVDLFELVNPEAASWPSSKRRQAARAFDGLLLVMNELGCIEELTCRSLDPVVAGEPLYELCLASGIEGIDFDALATLHSERMHKFRGDPCDCRFVRPASYDLASLLPMPLTVSSESDARVKSAVEYFLTSNVYCELLTRHAGLHPSSNTRPFRWANLAVVYGHMQRTHPKLAQSWRYVLPRDELNGPILQASSDLFATAIADDCDASTAITFGPVVDERSTHSLVNDALNHGAGRILFY